MDASSKLQKGQLLIAEPFMADINFKRAVVYLCDHDDQSSFGFVLNRPLDIRMDELVSDFPPFEGEVFLGGPVQTDTIHFLHNLGDLLENSQKISDGIYWGGDFEKLKFLIKSQLAGPENLRFFIGYAGWGEGQLAAEIEQGSWVISHIDPNYIFNAQADQLWQKILEHKGDTFSVIAQMPDNANWN